MGVIKQLEHSPYRASTNVPTRRERRVDPRQRGQCAYETDEFVTEAKRDDRVCGRPYYTRCQLGKRRAHMDSKRHIYNGGTLTKGLA